MEAFLPRWLSGETSQDVFFDNFRIQSTPSTTVQVTHYYPFGMEMPALGYQAGGMSKNRYLYNQGAGEVTFDTERLPELNIDLTQFRAYDPALGRWWQVDPLADEMSSWTPYNYSFNNPIRFNDPLGDAPGAKSYIGNTNDNIGQEQSKEWFGNQQAMFSNGGRDVQDHVPSSGDKENCCPIDGNDLTSGELQNQKYPVSVNLNDKPDKLFDDIISMYNWLFEGPFIRQPNDGRKNNFFNINDFVSNIPEKGDGLTAIVSRTLVTSNGIKFTWAIQPYNVNRSENYHKGYISSMQSNKWTDRGQIHLIGGQTNKNAVFTLTIFDKSNYEPVFKKIYKGYK